MAREDSVSIWKAGAVSAICRSGWKRQMEITLVTVIRILAWFRRMWNVVITLGGDGTLIQAARDLAGRQIPMLGINMGTLGYLTQISGQEAITPRLAELVSDQFQLEHRMMLKGTVVRHGKVIAKNWH